MAGALMQDVTWTEVQDGTETGSLMKVFVGELGKNEVQFGSG